MGGIIASAVIAIILAGISIFSNKTTNKLKENPKKLRTVQTILGIFVVALIAFAIIRVRSSLS